MDAGEDDRRTDPYEELVRSQRAAVRREGAALCGIVVFVYTLYKLRWELDDQGARVLVIALLTALLAAAMGWVLQWLSDS